MPCRAAGADRPDREDRRLRPQPAPHVPQPDVDARTRRNCSNGTRPARSRCSTSRRAPSARSASRRWCASLDVSPDAKYVRVTRMVKPFSYDVPVSSFGSIEEVWDADGKMLAKVTDRADQPRRAGRHAAAGSRRRRRRRPRRPAAGQARDRVARRRPGPHLPRAGAGPAGERSGARRGAGGSAPAPTIRIRRATRRPRRAAAAQGSPLSVDRPVRRGQQEGHLRERHAHDRHRFSPDMQILFFSERAGQNAVETAVYLNDTAQEVHARALPRRGRLRQSRTLVSTRGTAGGGRGAGGGGGGRARRRRRRHRPGAAVGRRPERVLPGHGLRPQPQRGRPEDLHRQGRDQDRREVAHLRERQRQRLRARHRRSSTSSRQVHRLAREPDRGPAELPASRARAACS